MVETFAEVVAIVIGHKNCPVPRQSHVAMKVASVASESGVDDCPVIAMVCGLRDTTGGQIIAGDILAAGAIETESTGSVWAALCCPTSARLARGTY